MVVKTKDNHLCINGLVCLGKLLPVMDKWIFQVSAGDDGWARVSRHQKKA